MTSQSDTNIDRMDEALRSSLLANDKLRRRNQDLVATMREPIAIVGMGCRLPGGVSSPEDLWRLVADGVDAIGPFPSDRGWDLDALLADDPALQSSRSSWRGGFLNDVAGFDAGFFGISAREALAMDPQQRLLLEIAWETIERAGIVPGALRGTPVGVFVGAPDQGYVPSVDRRVPEIDGYRLQGGLGSIASGRIAYSFGFNGPAITIDTACSSSLVAVHLALRALHAGDCSMAFAGGAMVIATPDVFVEFIRQGGLASDGRCKAFAEGADGTGFSEGCGLLLLERLSDATRHGHPVLAVIRGSAINQDGASNGLTAPSGPAQERVIRQALENAGLASSDVDLIEAHGTGTALGDPIEAQALIETYGRERAPGRPLWLGSLKSNIGHTQIAAGVAGIIKTVMALRHRHMPRTLHAATPSSRVAWPQDDVRLLVQSRDWPDGPAPRRAAVSAFGISGTNAHIILEEAPPREARPETDLPARPIAVPGGVYPLSAASPAALQARAAQIAALLRAPGAPGAGAVAAALAQTDAALPWRAVVQGRDVPELLAALDGLAADGPVPGIVRGTPDVVGETAFLFTGQGSQWPGMSGDLIAASPIFAAVLDEICALFDAHLPSALKTVMLAEPDTPEARLLDRTDFTQAAIFAIEVALYRTITGLGPSPDVVAGHSIGEIAAAHVAGVFSLADAVTFVAARGRLMQALPGGGAMIAIEAREDEVLETLTGQEGCVTIAAINAPSSVVISGDQDIVLDIAAGWAAKGRRTTRLQVSHAFHSPRIDPMVEALQRVLEGLTFTPPDIDLVSTVTGDILTEEQARSAAYWARQARAPVRFSDALIRLRRYGVVTYLELGPDAVLTALGRMTADDGASTGWPDTAWTPTLRRNADGVRGVVTALARLYTRGHPVAWRDLLAAGDMPALPSYPFQHRRYWLVAPASGPASGVGVETLHHPFLTHRIETAGEDGWRLTGRLSIEAHPWLREHAVGGVATAPGAVTAELLLRAGQDIGCDRMESLVLHAPLPFPDDTPVDIQLHVQAADQNGRRPVDCYFRPHGPPEGEPGDGAWLRYASGMIAPAGHSAIGAVSESWADLQSWPPAHADVIDTAAIYDALAEIGVVLGPTFFRVQAAWRAPGGIFVEARFPSGDRAADGGFVLHPLLLDGGMQAALIEGMTRGDDRDAPEIRMLFSIGALTLYQRDVTAIRAHFALPVGDASTDQNDLPIRIADAQGRPVATIGSVVLRAANADATRPHLRRVRPYRLGWQVLQPAGSQPISICGIGGAPDAFTFAATSDLTAFGNFSTVEAAAAALLDFDAVVLACPSDRNVSPSRAAYTVTCSVLRDIQSWLADPRTVSYPLVILTQGAVATTAAEDAAGLGQAGVWGLVRAAQREHPGRLFILDWDGSAASRDRIPAAVSAMLAGEPMLALRQGALCVPRLLKSVDPEVLALPGEGGEWRLAIREGAVGGLEDLALVPASSAVAGERDVKVAVRAAGLNFRDLLITLGSYPAAATLGSELAGVVVATGAGVTRFRVGDRVMGMGWSGTIGSHATTDERHLAPIPDGWTFAEAATVPSAFLTAWQALVDTARLRAGDRVLVHAGTGGVGMAAIAIARHLGAEVFATAHPAKIAVLRQLGIAADHCASSRDTAFANTFETVGGGRGMDVILHSLSGEMTQASMRLLAPGGRLIDIGRTDAGSADGFDRGRVPFVLSTDPEVTAASLAVLGTQFDSGALGPLPVTAMDVRRAREALQLMRDGKHIGRIVLMMPRPIDPDGTVLVTGGAGALGRLAARHLVAEHGARHVLLASRRGPDVPGAADLRAELEAMGAEVTIAACDLSDPDALAGLVSGISPLRPLTAILHAAGTADPVDLVEMGSDHVERVMRGKADAAWHLHTLTRTTDLAAFVFYSSAVGITGLPGQGNYAAANTFLDALAAHRRHVGLPAIAMSWGIWEERSDMGEGIGAERLRQIFEAGFQPMTAGEGLSYLDAGLGDGHQSHETLLVPMRLSTKYLETASDPLLSALASRTDREARPDNAKVDLMAMPEAVRRERLIDLIRIHVDAVLRGEPQSILPTTLFRAIGFDSLTAVEMSNRLASVTGLVLPPTVVFDHPTPGDLTTYLLARLAEKGARAGTAMPELKGTASNATRSGLGEILRAAVLDGRAVEGLRVMEAVAALRPKFSDAEASEQTPDAVWLRRDGEDKPLLICLDSFIPAAGNLTYQKLSGVLGSTYDIASVALPGFLVGQKLPETRDAMAAALATAVQNCADGRPFTLVGFSTGGLAAHIAAIVLEHRGTDPLGVVLIDTFPANTMNNASLSEVLGDWAGARGAFWSDEEDGLSAMAWYLALFDPDWRPARLRAPLYLARADRPMLAAAEDDRERRWPDLHACLSTPGSHFSLLTDHVSDTARTILGLLQGDGTEEAAADAAASPGARDLRQGVLEDVKS